MSSTVHTPAFSFPRYFTSKLQEDRSPFEDIHWEARTASITGGDGTVIFEQKDVEVPADWSQTATNIVASKYFHGKMDTPERERSVSQLVDRVVGTIAGWGLEGGYFATPEDAKNFEFELAHLMLTQKASFNSPVWFNVGVRGENRGYGWYFDKTLGRVIPIDNKTHRPQCSACFINSVTDSLESILDLAKTEGMLFKLGSGTGSNLSPLREENCTLQGGGRASGPLSFMRGFDAFAGVIKSGGKTRRAAKMVILNAEHPDIERFIWCKAKEEEKAHTLIEAGYDSSLDGEAYKSIFFQNANNSVRVTDAFMQAVVNNDDWWTRSVATGEPVQKFRARELMRQLAEATWQCGDPGMQFDTTINKWHTSKNSGRINASNPCSEYMFVDDSACNLSSLNLKKFMQAGGEFDVESYRRAIHTMTLAQEILVGNASYPTAAIAENSQRFRPLGLGYANLGSLLMSLGLPYDSPGGRAWAGALTAIMTGQAYLTSAQIAGAVGACEGYAANATPFLEVIEMHRQSLAGIDGQLVSRTLLDAAADAWSEALKAGREFGYRNSQVTVLAPTGTIGFMMDCDTTGIEPELALVKYKKLVGGGVIKIVNQTVPSALIRLGYSSEEMEQIVAHIDARGTIEGAPGLKAEDLAVFDCSLQPTNGTRFIQPLGHIRMMAAVQPFLSGAISKTINMPEAASVDDVMDAYIESWKLGLKAVAIYRDGSKKAQPLNTSAAKKQVVEERIVYRPQRRKLPDERQSITHKFSIAGHEGYVTVGMFEDGTPGELFITMAKEGSTISGLMDSFATAVSFGLQYGVPLKFYVDKFSHVRFEPSGFTGNPRITYAKSIMDYIFRWLALKFIGPDTVENEAGGELLLRPTEPDPQQQLPFGRAANMQDAPSCAECGGIMTRNGSCYKCENCGGTSGCS
ncbi:MAG: vitamin B12-dependent ribonucleotide reductase [Bryobacterales bacterium]|nr:vitamin B12-dependent ribonucleotide reductase [Bryobacterales bacterium]